MFGNKSSEKSEKNGFFIFTQISLPKNGGGKTRETIFPETRIVRAKNDGKKIDGKKCEKRFFMFTTIS